MTESNEQHGSSARSARSTRSAHYTAGSLTLTGAGIFTLTGPLAELAGTRLPRAFLAVILGGECLFLRRFH